VMAESGRWGGKGSRSSGGKMKGSSRTGNPLEQRLGFSGEGVDPKRGEGVGRGRTRAKVVIWANGDALGKRSNIEEYFRGNRLLRVHKNHSSVGIESCRKRQSLPCRVRRAGK